MVADGRPIGARVTRTRAAFDHVTVVRAPAYAGAGVVGVRAGHDDRVRVPLVTLTRPWRQGRAATRSEQTIPGA